MTDIAVPPYWAMVVQELLKPFFIFQVFSLGVWTLQEYYIYMYSILIMTAYSALANAYGEWRNLRALQTLARSEAVVDRVEAFLRMVKFNPSAISFQSHLSLRAALLVAVHGFGFDARTALYAGAGAMLLFLLLNASPTTCASPLMPRSCSRGISTRQDMSSRKVRSVNTWAIMVV